MSLQSWLFLLWLVSAPSIAEGPLGSHSRLADPGLQVSRIDEPGDWQRGPQAAIWARAMPVGALTQVDPLEGAKPTAATDIRLIRDDRSIYILARMHDAAPERIIAREMERGASIDGDDLLRIVIDSYGRGREGYLFEVNAIGNRREALLEGDQIANFNWDGRWEAHAAVDEHGWWAAVGIPFTSLSFDPDNTEWRFNFERNQRRYQERSRWTNLDKSQWVAAISQAAPIAGFDGVAPGLGLRITPNVRLTTSSGPQSRDTQLFEAGVDGSYQLTRRLRLTATVNTDFAEAEIDSREVNLDRFPLFFPERRQFFQQDASFFRFGGIDYSPWPVFTRRIGLDPAGNPIPIRGGLRLTGRDGPWTIGALGVAVEAADHVPARELGVVRIARDLDDRSTIGTIMTYGEPRGPGHNQMAGLDYSYINNDSVLGLMEARLWAMHAKSDLAGGQDQAFGWQLRLPSEPWLFYQYVGQVGSQFDPGLGFVRRRGIREYINTLTYRPQINHAHLRSMDLTFNPYVVTDLDNRLETFTVDLPRLVLRHPGGDWVMLRLRRVEERLNIGFNVVPGLPVAAGDYRWHQAMLDVSTTSARPVSAGFTARHGGFFDGRRTDYSTRLDWRPRAGWILGGSLEQRDLRLAAGSTQVRLATASSRINMSPRLSVSAIWQYDNITRELGFNARLRWIVGQDNDLFLVFNRLQLRAEEGTEVLAQSALAKLQWTFFF